MVKNGGERLPFSSVAIGNFDGVHIGHAKIISECKKFAEKNSIQSVVFSFDETPINVIKGKTVSEKIISDASKAEILDEMGIDVLYVQEFSDVRNMSAEDFCRKILVETLSAKAVFCGFNFTFGRDGKGNCNTLKEILLPLGVKVFVSEEEKIDGVTVSSTVIRRAISEGDAEKAKVFLGRNFFLSLPFQIEADGETKRVSQTVPCGFVLPKSGEYQTKITFDGKEFQGVSRVFDRKAETLFSCAEKIKTDKIKVEFIKRITENRK